MKLHHDGIHYNFLHFAAVAKASHQVWLGGETPQRMPWQIMPDAITRILDRYIARQRQAVQLRRLLLDAVGSQLSALPPPAVRVNLKVPVVA